MVSVLALITIAMLFLICNLFVSVKKLKKQVKQLLRDSDALQSKVRGLQMVSNLLVKEIREKN